MGRIRANAFVLRTLDHPADLQPGDIVHRYGSHHVTGTPTTGETQTRVPISMSGEELTLVLDNDHEVQITRAEPDEAMAHGTWYQIGDRPDVYIATPGTPEPAPPAPRDTALTRARAARIIGDWLTHHRPERR